MKSSICALEWGWMEGHIKWNSCWLQNQTAFNKTKLLSKKPNCFLKKSFPKKLLTRIFFKTKLLTRYFYGMVIANFVIFWMLNIMACIHHYNVSIIIIIITGAIRQGIFLYSTLFSDISFVNQIECKIKLFLTLHHFENSKHSLISFVKQISFVSW